MEQWSNNLEVFCCSYKKDPPSLKLRRVRKGTGGIKRRRTAKAVKTKQKPRNRCMQYNLLFIPTGITSHLGTLFSGLAEKHTVGMQLVLRQCAITTKLPLSEDN